MLEKLLEEHKRQIEDYAVELRLADDKLASLAGVSREPALDAERLHEQRLRDAYLALCLTELEGEVSNLSMLAVAKRCLDTFEKHGQEGEKP